MIKTIYNKLWWQFQIIRSMPVKRKLKQEILEELQGRSLTPELKEVYDFLKKRSLQTYPYLFTDQYKAGRIQVFTDPLSSLNYVRHNGYPLYFKRGWGNDRIRRAYATLCCEQHDGSPHCYRSPGFGIQKGDIMADVGSAEGIFSLNHVEDASHIYLFETDEGWIEALNATFSPWAGKVTVVNRYVSDRNSDKEVTLDDYFAQKQVNFVKADVEGAESALLKGGADILSRPEVRRLAITTYHKPNDAVELWESVSQLGFKPRFTHGYMIFTGFGKPERPYLRRGVIQAEK